MPDFVAFPLVFILGCVWAPIGYLLFMGICMALFVPPVLMLAITIANLSLHKYMYATLWGCLLGLICWIYRKAYKKVFPWLRSRPGYQEMRPDM